jgi:hypothetical protein
VSLVFSLQLLLELSPFQSIVMSIASQAGHQQGAIRPINFNSLGFMFPDGVRRHTNGKCLTVEIVNDANGGSTSTSTLPFFGGGEDNNWTSRVSPESVYARLQRPTMIPQEKDAAVVDAVPLTIPEDARTIYSILWDGDFLFLLEVEKPRIALIVSSR